MPTALLTPTYTYGRYVVPSDTVDNIRGARYLVNTGSSGVLYVRQNYEAGITGAAPRTQFSSAGSGFVLLGQPQNDALEILSSDAGDTTQTITIWGTTTGTDTVVSEAIALNGTTQVVTTKTDWGFILGFELDAVCAGTLTVREASGNVTLTTIAIGLTSKGVYTIPIAGVDLVTPRFKGSAASTKVVGIVGTNSSGAAADDSNPLNGTEWVDMNAQFNTVTKLLVGDVETAVTVTLELGSYLKMYLSQGGSTECGASWLGVNSTSLGSGVEIQALF